MINNSTNQIWKEEEKLSVNFKLMVSILLRISVLTLKILKLLLTPFSIVVTQKICLKWIPELLKLMLPKFLLNLKLILPITNSVVLLLMLKEMQLSDLLMEISDFTQELVKMLNAYTLDLEKKSFLQTVLKMENGCQLLVKLV